MSRKQGQRSTKRKNVDIIELRCGDEQLCFMFGDLDGLELLPEGRKNSKADFDRWIDQAEIIKT